MANDNDKAVLNAIFNPNTPFESNEDEDNEPNKMKSTYVITDEIQKAKDLEVEGVKAAENGDLKKSIELFTKAIETSKDWASAYNNRAQALRLLNDIEGALRDLDMAIKLSAQYTDGKVLSLASTQRGMIYRLQGKDEEALKDFKIASSLGNVFARHQMIACNPYAALCNKALNELIEKVKLGLI